MSLIPLVLAAAATATEPGIVVTASRTPVARDLAGASVSVIDLHELNALDFPLVADYLRLVPSVAVASSGPAGAQTQVRIRGAESNQTLVYIDGIKMNDPASSGDFRWETLLTDFVEQVEVLRGPQSALWGSEAIGGVVNITTRAADKNAGFGQIEAGSHGTFIFGRGASFAKQNYGITGQLTALGSQGIDTSDSDGDRDGYRNFTAATKGFYTPSATTEVGYVFRYIKAKNWFDDFDYSLGQVVDAPLSTKITTTAARGYGRFYLADGAWANQVDLTYSGTKTFNYDDGAYLGQADGSTLRAAYQSTATVHTGRFDHKLTGAVEYQHFTFDSQDVDPLALSNQSQSRDQTSLIGDYRLTYASIASVSGSVRRDFNTQFEDTTTWRATGAIALPAGLRVHGSWGEGVADPTFYDLYGFFPDFFVGNPDLVPETSNGWDAGVGWAGKRWSFDFTGYQTTLFNEIVPVYDFTTGVSTVANATGRSRRTGYEIEFGVLPLDWLRLEATYAYLDATEQQVAAGQAIREVRRPKNSGSLSAIVSKPNWQASVTAAFVGAREDTNFATLEPVTLPAYTLVNIAGAYRLRGNLAATFRIENATDARYQDVYGYRTLGLGVFVGLKLGWDD